ncbi:MAG: response regulator [Planctomycetota bacterium]|nr:MAG: response regulator [Planctomycetota bacterium]
MNVLIIDDSSLIRGSLCAFFESIGFNHYEAENGKEALDLVAKIEQWELILVDWNMPVMDGLEFVKCIRKVRKYDSVKLIMVSGENKISYIEEAMVAGSDGFIMKPFGSTVLEEKLSILGIEIEKNSMNL